MHLEHSFYLDLDGLKTFQGWCRYESNPAKGAFSKNNEWIKSLNTNTASECQQQCQATQDCAAFAYSYNDGDSSCGLYKGGPFKGGNGRPGTTCYVMDIGKLNLFSPHSLHFINDRYAKLCI